MRIWDIPVTVLCDRHLCAEHLELHIMWNTLTGQNDGGYGNHPETKRWQGKLAALSKRHDKQVKEMAKRGFSHKSPLMGIPTGSRVQRKTLITKSEQIELLHKKAGEGRCRAPTCAQRLDLVKEKKR